MRAEIYRLFLLSAAGYLAGRFFGHPGTGTALALLLGLAAQLRQLAVLHAWAEHPKRVDLPETGGLWGRVYKLLYERRERYQRRKRQLSQIIAEFRASTEALPDGAVVLAAGGEIVWFNSAAQALLGLRPGQDEGQRIVNFVRRPAFTEYFSRAEFKDEVEVTSRVNPAVTLSLRVISYGIGQKLMIVRDVSELRRLDTARRDFVANASHELRTPLTVLRGYLDMMEPESREQGSAAEGSRPPSLAREAGEGGTAGGAGGGVRGSLAVWRAPLVEMRAQAARMEALIADMLKLARLESDVFASRQEVLDVPAMLGRVLEEARVLSREQHPLDAQVEPGLFLFGRDGEAQSIFLNLVENAIHYTPAGGRVTLRWWGDGEGAHFSVTDSGIGIEEKDIPRVTERFYRVDVGRSRATGGTGLGLSIVKHALERHEARLEIQSRLGQGSTFICHFPLHRVQRKPAAAANG